MTEPGGPTAATIDLAALQRGLSTVGWGYVIGAVVPGPAFVSPSGRIGFPSVFGAIVVLVGLSTLPLRGLAVEFARRRLVVAIAVAVGWVGSVASYFPATGPVPGAVGSIASALAVLLFAALMTRLMAWLGADQPHQAWRRLTRFVLVVVCIGPVVMALAALVVPRLPGATVAAPNGSGTFVNGYQVSGVALAVAIVVSIVFLAGTVVALVQAVQAFGATKRWTRSQLPAPARTARAPSVVTPARLEEGSESLEAPPRSRTRVVDGRVILLVDRTPPDGPDRSRTRGG